jgi:hypothetical protein
VEIKASTPLVEVELEANSSQDRWKEVGIYETGNKIN